MVLVWPGRGEVSIHSSPLGGPLADKEDQLLGFTRADQVAIERESPL